MIRVTLLLVIVASLLATLAVGRNVHGGLVPGTTRWNYTTSDALLRNPLLSVANAVIISSQKNLICLSSDDGTPQWMLQGNYSAPAASSSSQDSVLVYAVSASSVVAVDFVSAMPQWIVITPSTSRPNPSHQPVVVAANIVYLDSNGHLSSVFTANGSHAWTNTAWSCGNDLARIVAAGGTSDSVIVSCGTSLLHVNATSGKSLWSVREQAIYSPLVLGSRVLTLIVTSYTPQLSGNLSCFELSTGRKLWTIGINEYLFASPTPSADDANVALLTTWFRNEGGAWTSTWVYWIDVLNGNITYSLNPDLSSGVSVVVGGTYISGSYQGLQAFTYNETYLWGATSPGYVDHPAVAVGSDTVLWHDDQGNVFSTAC